MKKNILYLLNHQTLTDFEIPILIKKGYGVLIPKKYDSLDKNQSLYKNDNIYDNFLELSHEKIKILNDIDWYSNKILDTNVITILNDNFSFIFITLLIEKTLLQQLLNLFTGKIYYRFFGRESNLRYNNLIPFCHEKVKFIFSYEEIYNFETQFDNFFNKNNSFIIPLGLSTSLIAKIYKTYNPINNRLCFICSKINICPYYTQIYKDFINNFSDFDYVIIGRNNKNTNNKKIMNNLENNDYYKQIIISKVLYYHGKEPRHLHYHPIEAIFIGIPVIFHKESLLSKYLYNSKGMCTTIHEAKNKCKRILNNDIQLINEIIIEQNKVLHLFTIDNNLNIFDVIFE